MADPKELANKARTTLAEALQALQSAAELPERVQNMAEPIAVTMGILHRIERSGAPDAQAATQALKATRDTLDALQNSGITHAAIDSAMEAVAGSLSKLYALAKAMPGASTSVQPGAPGATIPLAEPPLNKTAVMDEPAPLPTHGDRVVAPQRTPKSVPPGPPPPRTKSVPPPRPGSIPPPPPRPGSVPPPPRPPSVPPAAVAPTQAATFVPQPPAPPPTHKERVPGTTDAPMPPATASTLEVELGAHSGSNFYKGLSGNDVIDHGGIFVATYNVPKMGDAVALRMLLPGDLEFDADVVVQWVRESHSGDPDSVPGFGARFTNISPEGRQLVYRYVRNREPMFYDDM